MNTPFVVGEAVSLTVAGQPNFNFTHKIVSSVNNTANVGGYFGRRIVVDHDSSAVGDTFDPTNYAELRASFKVAVKTQASTGTVFIQQVQET